jgi:hypothetical protein
MLSCSIRGVRTLNLARNDEIHELANTFLREQSNKHADGLSILESNHCGQRAHLEQDYRNNNNKNNKK